MSLTRNIVANYLGQGWVALMGIAFVPLYVKALGVEAYGLVGVFAVLQAWMTILDLGVTPTLNRETARLRAGAHTAVSIRDLLRSLEIVFAGLAVAMIVAIWFAARWLVDDWLQSSALSSDLLVRSLRLMGFVLVTRWLEQIYRGALLGLQDQVWLNAAQALLATLRWGGAYVVVTFVWPTVLAFFVWQGLVSLVASIVLIQRTYAKLPGAARAGRFDVAALKEVKAFASGMFAGAILSFALTQADKIVISKMLSLEQLGFYMVAATAAGGLLQLITPMNNAIYPRLTEQVTRRDQEGLIRTFHDACEWMAAIIIPPALVLAFFAGPVLLLWTGDARLTSSVATLLALLVLGTLCNGLMNLPYMLQLAHGWTSLAVGTNAVAVVLVVPAIIWSVSRYGAIGAAAAWLTLNLCYLVFAAHWTFRRLMPSGQWRWYRQAVVQPLAVGGLAGFILTYSLPTATARGDAIINVAIAVPALFAVVALSLPRVRSAAARAVSGAFATLPR